MQKQKSRCKKVTGKEKGGGNTHREGKVGKGEKGLEGVQDGGQMPA